MDSGGVINRHDKGKALYFPFHTLTIKGNKRKGRFMLRVQEFLSLDEAVSLSQEFELNLKKEDILYLSSLGLFKAFNNITYVFRGVVDKPIYKINGLKGLYKSCLPTQNISFSEKLKRIVEDESNFTSKKERIDPFWVFTITSKSNINESISASYSFFEFELSFVDFGYATVAFPYPSYYEREEENARQYDLVRGMIESPLIKNVAERNKPQNAKLLTQLLLKSLDNHYAPNADFDVFFFRIEKIASYIFSLEPYVLDYSEMNDQDLVSINNEHNFDNIFYFECNELIKCFKKLSNKDFDEKYDQSAELQKQISELQVQLAEKDKIIEKLEKENQSLQAKARETIQEYDGDIPLQTDKDKLAHTFKLIIQQSKFVEMNGGKYPTYSQLHTMLNRTYKDELIPSKNTLKKYLEP